MSLESELREALDKINEIEIPVAIVSHPRVKQELLNRGADFYSGQINGIPMYVFEDVPQDQPVVFYDQRVLRDYLRYRNSCGHELALAKVMLDNHIKHEGYGVDLE